VKGKPQQGVTFIRMRMGTEKPIPNQKVMPVDVLSSAYINDFGALFLGEEKGMY
jgi:hypothetical protein